MRKKENKKIKMVRAENPVLGIIFKIIAVICSCAMMLFLVAMSFYYILFMKISPAKEDLAYKKASYEAYGEEAFKNSPNRYRVFDCEEDVYKDSEIDFAKDFVLHAPFKLGDPIEIYVDQKVDNEIEEDSNELPYWLMFKTNDGKVVLCEYVLKVQKMDIWSLGTIGLIILIFILAGAIGIIASIIKGAKRHKRMLNLLFFDEVTNGNNWLWFTYNGEKRLRKKKTASNKYAIVDILLIKYNNYCLCHSVDEGNQLLIKVNNALRKFVDKDEMVARKASADFVLLVNYDNEEELNKRITGLVSHLEHILDDHKLSFHAGIKPIEFRTDFEKEYSYARAARNTMESSDDSGVCLFDQKILDEQIWLENVTDRQEYAIKNEEFMVYYQPKYDPRTDELKGAEALIRWQSDKYGFVSPGRIIPIFEKNGFITEIDHYMIRHVARDQKKFKEAGLKIVPVSVNVSRAHFMENDLAEQIRDMVNDEGASPEYIEIELTESAFFDDKKAMIETISKLKEYGFSVSMDDFGSGYSSLNSLKDMPLDVLKLDAEFFRGDSSDERREIVVSEAIKLAKSLNMKTVAEGVEIKEQVDFLAKQGCDLIQGYYYAKPMPVSEYEERLEAHE